MKITQPAKVKITPEVMDKFCAMARLMAECLNGGGPDAAGRFDRMSAQLTRDEKQTIQILGKLMEYHTL